jgi:hypothetical protein
MKRNIDKHNFYEVTNVRTAQLTATFLFELHNNLLTGNWMCNGILL